MYTTSNRRLTGQGFTIITGGIQMRGYEAAKILKDQGITIEDVKEEIAYRKETNALSNQPKNEAFMNMTLNEVLRISEMWDV